MKKIIKISIVVSFTILISCTKASESDTATKTDVPLPPLIETATEGVITETTLASISPTNTSPVLSTPTVLPDITGKIIFWGNPEDFDDWAFYMYDLTDQNLTRITDYEKGRIRGPVLFLVSLDGKFMAAQHRPPKYPSWYLVDLKTFETRDLPTTSGIANYPSFDLSGKYIAYDDWGTELLDINNWQVVRLTDEYCSSKDWDPISDRLICVKNSDTERDLFFYYIEEDRFERITYLDARYIISPRWASSGERIAFVLRLENEVGQLIGTELYVVEEIDELNKLVNFSEFYLEEGDEVYYYAWHPNGRVIAVAYSAGTFTSPNHLIVVDLVFQEVLYQSESTAFNSPFWAVDGSYLGYVRYSNGDKITFLDFNNYYKVIREEFIGNKVISPVWVSD